MSAASRSQAAVIATPVCAQQKYDPGASRLNTSADDFFPIEDMRLARFDGTTWVLIDRAEEKP